MTLLTLLSPSTSGPTNQNVTPTPVTLTWSTPQPSLSNQLTGFQKAVGSFVLRNTDGSQRVTLTSALTFTPKLVLFFSGWNNSWNDIASDNWEFQFGAATSQNSTNQFTHSVKCQDNFPGSSFPGRNYFKNDGYCINVLGWWKLGGSNIPANRILAKISTFTQDGFILDITVDTTLTSGALQGFPTDTEVYYIALGGNDFKGLVKVGTGNTTSITNIGFTPKAVMTVGSETANKTLEAPIVIGAATSPSNQLHTELYGTDDGSVTRGRTESKTDSIYRVHNDTGGTVVSGLSLSSIGANDISFTTFGTTGTSDIGFILFGGNCLYDVGSFAGATTTGNQDVSSLISPEALLFFGDNIASHNDYVQPMQGFFGASLPGSSNFSLATAYENAVATSNVGVRKSNTKSISSVTTGSSTVQAQASITQRNTPTGFRANWSSADSTSRIFNFLGIASAPAITPTPITTTWSTVSPTVHLNNVIPTSNTATWSTNTPTLTASGGTSVAGFKSLFGFWAGGGGAVVASNVNITPAAVTVNWNTNTPSVQPGAINITPTVVVVTWTTVTPIISKGGVNKSPSALGLAWTTVAPTIQVGAVFESPTAVTLTWSTNTPTISKGGRNITPNACTVTWSTVTPTCSKGGVNESPNSCSVTWSNNTPTITKGGRNLTPSACVATWSTNTPTVSVGGRNLTPTANTASWSTNTPAITRGEINVSPSANIASWSTQPPIVNSGAGHITPTPLTAHWSTGIPFVSIELKPTANTATWSNGTPTVSRGGKNLTPTACTASWSTNTPSVTKGGRNLTPSACTATWSTATPTTSAGAGQISPSACTAHWSTVAPTVSVGERNITPNACVATWSNGTPTVTSRKNLTPTANTAHWSTNTPTVTFVQNNMQPNSCVAYWSTGTPSISGLTSENITPTACEANWSTNIPSRVGSLEPVFTDDAEISVKPTISDQISVFPEDEADISVRPNI